MDAAAKAAAAEHRPAASGADVDAPGNAGAAGHAASDIPPYEIAAPPWKLAGDFSIKVTLPGQPQRKPRQLDGVKVTYDFAERPAEFVALPEPGWMEAVRRARRKAG